MNTLCVRARSRANRGVIALAVGLILSPMAVSVLGDERKFAVMLAVPRKSIPGDPQNFYPLLPGINDVWDEYFDTVKDNVDSFAEYWNEISYGTVNVSGDVVGWVDIPWPVLPADLPDNPDNLDSCVLQFTDLNNNTLSNQFQGESFIESRGAVLIDFNGGLDGTGVEEDLLCRNLGCFSNVTLSFPDGFVDFPAPSTLPPVWSPGERFLDLDSDGAYDAYTEPVRDGWLSEEDPSGNPLAPCTGVDGLIDTGEFCDTNGDDVWNFAEPFEDFLVIYVPDFILPEDRWVRLDPSYKNETGDPIYDDDPKAVGSRAWSEAYIRRNYPGWAGQPIRNAGEEGEGFMARFGNDRYDPPDLWIEEGSSKMQQRGGNLSVLFGVSTPSPERLCQGGVADGDPCITDEDCSFGGGVCFGGTLFAWSYLDWWESYWIDSHVAAGFEMSEIRQAPQAPAWPLGGAIPRMQEFDPLNPSDAATPADGARGFNPNTGGTTTRVSEIINPDTGEVCIPVQPDPGAVCNGAPAIPQTEVSPGNGVNIQGSGGGNLSGTDVVPDTIGGTPMYYDGPAEFRDLPSSQYHARRGMMPTPSGYDLSRNEWYGGDGRMGEVTSTFQIGEGGGDPWGHDIGTGNPSSPGIGADGIIPPAGPPAYNIHGTNGYDAGNVLMLEYLTWTTNDAETFLQPAGDDCYITSTCTPFPNVLQRDFNLDGLIDMGEVRGFGTENYACDASALTPNDGGPGSNYPFNRRRLTEDVVEALDSSVDWDQLIAPIFGFNFLFGTVMLPDGLHADGLAAGGRGLFQLPAPAMNLPIMTRDLLEEDSDPEDGIPPGFAQILFSDFTTAIGATGEAGQQSAGFQKELMAHEFLHVWEGYPDLYDYDVYIDGFENCPVAAWDIMAGGTFVHPAPFMKEAGTGIFYSHDPWIESTDLTTMLRPLQETQVVLTDYADDPNDAVFYYPNSNDNGERFYFWRITDRTIPNKVNFSTYAPSTGVLVMHTDLGNNFEGIPLQNRIGSHFTYNIVQADGLQQLDPCENQGDAGDPFPGSTNRTTWDETTDPNSRFWGQIRSGISITNITTLGDRSLVTFFWEPRLVPSLTITNPPGGTVIGTNYQLQYNAFDFFGGTTIEFFIDDDDTGYDGVAAGPTVDKDIPEFIQGVFPVDLSDPTIVPGDGTYHFYARLTPGMSQDGTEPAFSEPSLTVGSHGRGRLLDTSAVPDVLTIDPNLVKFEAWTLTCTDDTNAGQEAWTATGSLSGTQTTTGLTGGLFATDDGSIQFIIEWLGMLGGGGNANVSNTAGEFKLVDTDANFVANDFRSGDRIRITAGATLGFYTITAVPNPTTLMLASDAGDSAGAGGVLYRVHSFSDGSDGGEPDAFAFITTGLTAYSAPINFSSGDIDPQIMISVGISYPDDANNPERRAPLDVLFNASDTKDENGETNAALIYDWDFGDGSDPLPNGGAVVEHTYTGPNADGFEAMLTVTNPDSGVFSDETVDVVVMPALSDSDGDGVPNSSDNCPNIANANQTNSDTDNFGDVCDNCDAVNNNDQADADNDNMGDACDTLCPNDASNDADGDGICGGADNCPINANPNQADADGDGAGDECDATPNGDTGGGGGGDQGGDEGDDEGDDDEGDIDDDDVEPEGPQLSGMVGADGSLNIVVDADDGSASAAVEIPAAGGTTGSEVTVTLIMNSGAPGNSQTSTFDGFDGEQAVGTTIDAQSTMTAGTFQGTILLTVQRSEITALGLTPETVEMHVLDESVVPNTWVRAGTNYVGQSAPTGQLGDYGHQVSGDMVTFWAERNSFSLYAVGRNVQGPPQPRACDADDECDNDAFCDGVETCDEAGQCRPGTAPCVGFDFCNENADECVDCSVCDDGLFCNGVETCNASGDCLAGESPCDADELCDETNDTCVTPADGGTGDGPADGGIDGGDDAVDEPAPGTPVPGCADGGMCGTLGFISLGMMFIGLLPLRARFRDPRRNGSTR